MRAETFVPGHISAVFRPVRGDSPRNTGSLGLGIRLSLGCRASVSVRDDDAIRIMIDGKECEAPVTRKAVESMNPGTGLDISLEHDLPMSQGYGTSASGTYAAVLCVAALTGSGQEDAILAAHEAECTMGGGLGDLLAIDSGYGVPVRYVAGPPRILGKTSDSGLVFEDLTLITFDKPLKTESVLSDPVAMEKVVQAGDEALEMFREDGTLDGFFRASNMFSEKIGLESEDVREGLERLWSTGYHAAMCMLGNSIFTDAPYDEAKKLFPRADVVRCSSYSEPITVRTF